MIAANLNKHAISLVMPIIILICLIGVANAEENAVLRVAYQDRIGSVIPIVAEKKGFYSEEGLSVKTLRFSSGPACAEALYSGAADVAGMGDTAAIIMVARNPKFVIVASHATGEHRHRIMVKKDSTIQDINDLKGKRLGVKKGTSTYGGLLAALKKSNITPTDIGIIDLTPPTMTEALMAGSIDAFAASEPTPSSAEEKGARELMTLGGLGNEYPILTVANGDMIERHKGAVLKLLKAMKKAEVYAKNNPEEMVAMMSAETGLSPETARKAMQLHEYRLRLDASILSSLEQTAQFLKGQGILSDLPDFTKVVQNGLIESLSN